MAAPAAAAPAAVSTRAGARTPAPPTLLASLLPHVDLACERVFRLMTYGPRRAGPQCAQLVRCFAFQPRVGEHRDLTIEWPGLERMLALDADHDDCRRPFVCVRQQSGQTCERGFGHMFARSAAAGDDYHGLSGSLPASTKLARDLLGLVHAHVDHNRARRIGPTPKVLGLFGTRATEHAEATVAAAGCECNARRPSTPFSDVTPGITRNGTPALCSASISSVPRPKMNGSPPLRRTTLRPSEPSRTRIPLIVSCAVCLPNGSLPTSIISAPAANSRISGRSGCRARQHRRAATRARRRSSAGPGRRGLHPRVSRFQLCYPTWLTSLFLRCNPHSVLFCPAQRPSRSPSVSPTARVQGLQPMLR